jgi:predicted transcriptional regulator
MYIRLIGEKEAFAWDVSEKLDYAHPGFVIDDALDLLRDEIRSIELRDCLAQVLAGASSLGAPPWLPSDHWEELRRGLPSDLRNIPENERRKRLLHIAQDVISEVARRALVAKLRERIDEADAGDLVDGEEFMRNMKEKIRRGAEEHARIAAEFFSSARTRRVPRPPARRV